MSEMNEKGGAEVGVEGADRAERAVAFCQTLFGKMGIQAELEVKETEEAVGISVKPKEGNAVELTSVLVEAVQYLVNRVVNPKAEGRKWVNLDLGGFREDADPIVKAMAERLAGTAKKTGKVIAIAPISARERRQIHMSLVDVEGIETRSEGEGIFRQLLIIPEKAVAGSEKPAARE
jgi:spoIIIJ-associated protein